MQKMKTLFKMIYHKDHTCEITPEINEGCEWALEVGVPYRKYDGTACMIKNGILYKRYDAKYNKKTKKWKEIPEGAIPCQEKPDEVSGHFPCWIKVDFEDPVNQYHKEAFEKLTIYFTNIRTYELVGPKINGNKEGKETHCLLYHKKMPDIYFWSLMQEKKVDFETIKEYLRDRYMEGIVFHHPSDGRMCKIRKKDFGFKW